MKWSAICIWMLIILLYADVKVFAQATSCSEQLNLAEQAYLQGKFDDTISFADQCLNNQAITRPERQLAFRLKGLSYIGKGLETDARDSVRKLLEFAPSYAVDPVQDPPTFVQLIEEMRLEIAQNQEAAANTQVVNVVPQTSTNDTRNRLESWYTNWGLGYPVIQYPDELGAVLDALKDIGVSNTAVMLDLLGFYFPIGEKVIIGSNLNAWGDRYESNGESIQISAYTFGGSAMFFLQERIGDGVFLRSDLGLSRLVLASSGIDTESSAVGVGFLIGGGYGIPVSRETRILIHLNYSIRSIESETYSNLGISVSGLF